MSTARANLTVVPSIQSALRVAALLGALAVTTSCAADAEPEFRVAVASFQHETCQFVETHCLVHVASVTARQTKLVMNHG